MSAFECGWMPSDLDAATPLPAHETAVAPPAIPDHAPSWGQCGWMPSDLDAATPLPAHETVIAPPAIPEGQAH